MHGCLSEDTGLIVRRFINPILIVSSTTLVQSPVCITVPTVIIWIDTWSLGLSLYLFRDYDIEWLSLIHI